MKLTQEIVSNNTGSDGKFYVPELDVVQAGKLYRIKFGTSGKFNPDLVVLVTYAKQMTYFGHLSRILGDFENTKDLEESDWFISEVGEEWVLSFSYINDGKVKYFYIGSPDECQFYECPV